MTLIPDNIPKMPELNQGLFVIKDTNSLCINNQWDTNNSIEISKDAILGDNFKEKLMEEIMAQLSYKPLIQHKCHSCGATLNIDNESHIFKCKYCGSVYAFNTQMINAR